MNQYLENEIDDEENLDELGFGEESVETETQVQTGSTLSKEAKKIVALKKEIKQLRNQLGSTNPKDELLEQFKSKGYDEDTAEIYATNEVRLNELQSKLELQEFKENNLAVISKYPKAINDIKWLMDASKSTGMTVEEICRGRYGNDILTKEQRNKDAVMNEQGSSVNTSVSTALKNASIPADTNLTATDERQKEFFENLFGEKLSVKDYLDLKERRGL